MPSADTTTTTLQTDLRRLGFNHTADQLNDLIAGATRKRWSATVLLERIVADELEDKHRRSVESRLKRARLGRFKPLADWDSGLSGGLLAGVERQLSNEAAGASGYVMAMPDTGERGQDGADADEDNDPLTTLRRDMAAAKGKTTLAPATGAGFGMGAGAAPQQEYKPHRFGLNPPNALVELRRDVERAVMASYGLPPALANHAAAGQSLRESWRIAVSLSVAPVAELVAAQLREALDVPDLELGLDRLRAADVATLARAAHSLTQAGVDGAAALERVGL